MTLKARVREYRALLATDLFLFIYGKRSLRRFLVLLGWLGVPTAVLWIGTDVVDRAPVASGSVRSRAWHWCVAPWLRDELADVGIQADVARVLIPAVPGSPPPLPDQFSVLAYAPDHRADFYGLGFVLELARRLPHIPFRLVATTTLNGLPPNVSALGWVDDMESLMARTTVYVRPTRHDGLSNMVLESLACGRYVLWTYPFPGATVAGTVDAAEAWLADLHRRDARGELGPNQIGREAVLRMFDPVHVREQTLRRIETIVREPWRRPPGRVGRSVLGVTLAMLRSAFRPHLAAGSRRPPQTWVPGDA